MNKTIGLALIAASILAFATPSFAQTMMTNERMNGRSVMGGERYSAPVSLRERERERAPEQMLTPSYGWNGSADMDRASSPNHGGGY